MRATANKRKLSEIFIRKLKPKDWINYTSYSMKSGVSWMGLRLHQSGNPKHYVISFNPRAERLQPPDHLRNRAKTISRRGVVRSAKSVFPLGRYVMGGPGSQSFLVNGEIRELIHANVIEHLVIRSASCPR
jgi:hypothetical protein